MKKSYKCCFVILASVFAILFSFAQAAAFQKQSYMVEMRDGTRLATDIYFPDDYSKDKYADGIPVCLMRTPYNKDRDHPAVNNWRDCFVNNGYAFAKQDMRGYRLEPQVGVNDH